MSQPLQGAQSAVPRFGRIDAGLDQVDGAIGRAQDYLFTQQFPDGYWCGELEADSTLESDYIMVHVLLGDGDAPKMEGALAEIRRTQNEDGGWGIYAGGPSNISASVKAYFAFKLMGWSPDHPILVKAREWILAHGGVVECNTFTKLYLCFFGQYEYDAVPAIPPEIVLFPKWFYFNIYEISSWSRAILVPLSIAYAKKPFKKLTPEHEISELFAGGRKNADLHLRWDSKRILGWRNFFLFVDRLLHWAERVHIRPLRKIALKRAEKWILEHLEMSDGLGAIYPAMLNATLALRCLGYSTDDPQTIRAMDEFEKLGIEEDRITDSAGTVEPTFRMQPCMSPVWDTAYALYVLGESGMSRTDARLVRAANWMLSKEVRHLGDWAVKVPKTQPGGWYFEFNNEFYPDTDDSAQVLLALDKVDNIARERYQYDVCQRAIAWILAMQCKSGGWASFDKDNTKMVFENVPFADHNAMLDPPTVDITGRILEMLATYGYTKDDPRVAKAIKFIYREQEPDGSWFGRWGVNYLYGTFLVLRGLEAMGVWNHEPEIQQAAEWVRSVQSSDGGWGESCASYDDPSTRGVGTSTPSQTAWAILALLAAGDDRSDSVAKGIRWLLERQGADGSWDESMGEGRTRQAIVTGTGFPRVFYLAYHLYRNYFPLLALGNYRRAQTGD
ncbi:MAG TPA: squalene--hopene cyclase [Acidobacteriaceae bacterium]|jgi:squalene-hopene/tetraprenyl-beta-curcumene cyclase|nr:squalene--hopene cyclase [Acidobacteriaceae bacterium]